MTYTGIARGKTIELEEQVPYPDGQRVKIAIEPIYAKAKPGSPSDILTVVRSLPDIALEDVAELERVIACGKLPVSSKGIFDDDPTGRE